jgi:hypothetical protein
MKHQLILELNNQGWDKCWKIIEEVRKHDPKVGYKINPIVEGQN